VDSQRHQKIQPGQPVVVCPLSSLAERRLVGLLAGVPTYIGVELTEREQAVAVLHWVAPAGCPGLSLFPYLPLLLLLILRYRHTLGAGLN
jgi:hypothetical protein